MKWIFKYQLHMFQCFYFKFFFMLVVHFPFYTFSHHHFYSLGCMENNSSVENKGSIEGKRIGGGWSYLIYFSSNQLWLDLWWLFVLCYCVSSCGLTLFMELEFLVRAVYAIGSTMSLWQYIMGFYLKFVSSFC